MLRHDPADLASRPLNCNRAITPSNPGTFSRTVYAPAAIVENSEQMTQWSPYGTLYPHAYRGGHDGLQGRLMQVPQADTYDSSPEPWPHNGQWDRPSGFWNGLLRIPREASAHRGFAQPVYAGPPMLFQPPPPFAQQVRPIPAVGI